MRRSVFCAVAAAFCLYSSLSLAARSGWSIQHTPNPTGAHSSGLFSVSCLSGSNCLAVGSYQGGSLKTKALSARWNGHTWSIMPAQNPAGATFVSLSGVSCASTHACMAVGTYAATGGKLKPLAERWNGTKWTIVKTPTPASSTHTELDGVSCPSAHVCVAVGFQAIGGPYRTLVERWNGHRWSTQPTRRPPGATNMQLTSISCPSPRACTAVGYYESASPVPATLIEHWAGHGWRIQPSPNHHGGGNNYLAGVSCASLSACTAVGKYQNGPTKAVVVERWNGHSWSLEHAPNPSGALDVTLDAVFCVRAGVCTAVGYYENGAGSTLTLGEHSAGTKWSLQQPANPRHATLNELNGVACPSASTCTAVGDSALNVASTEKTLAERWTR
jgi:hypothetical protein